MKYLAMLCLPFRYVLYAVLSIFAVFLTWLLSWLLPLFVREDKETKQGNLPTWLSWFQSHDFPLDEVWRPSLPSESWREDGLFIKNFSMFYGKTSENFKQSYKLRYLARMFWLCRNAGYGFRAKVLGYPVKGSVVVFSKFYGAEWDTGKNTMNIVCAYDPTRLFWSRYAFHIRGQLFYKEKGSRYVRINVGWKLVMPDIAMIATHVNPIRKWD